MYTVVEFLGEDRISEIPVSWLNKAKDVCYWPLKDERNCILKKKRPEYDWMQFKCQVLAVKTYDNYEKARRVCAGFSKEEFYLPSSDCLISDDSTRMTRGKKMKKVNEKKRIYMNLSESESNDEEKVEPPISPSVFGKKSANDCGQRKSSVVKNLDKNFQHLSKATNLVVSTPSTSELRIDAGIASKFSQNYSLFQLSKSDEELDATSPQEYTNTLLDQLKNLQNKSTVEHSANVILAESPDGDSNAAAEVEKLPSKMKNTKPPSKSGERPPAKRRRTEEQSTRETELLQETHRILICDQDMEQLDLLLPKMVSNLNSLTGLVGEAIKFLIRIDRVVRSIYEQDPGQASKPFELEGFHIPFKNVEDFKIFEKRISKADFFNKVIERLGEFKPNVRNGNETESLVKDILVKSFPNEVAECMNLVGSEPHAKVQKVAFGETLYYKAIIKAVLKRNLDGREARKGMVAWFKNASIRKNGSKYLAKNKGKYVRTADTATPATPKISPNVSRSSPNVTPIRNPRTSSASVRKSPRMH